MESLLGAISDASLATAVRELLDKERRVAALEAALGLPATAAAPTAGRGVHFSVPTAAAAAAAVLPPPASSPSRSRHEPRALLSVPMPPAGHLLPSADVLDAVRVDARSPCDSGETELEDDPVACLRAGRTWCEPAGSSAVIDADRWPPPAVAVQALRFHLGTGKTGIALRGGASAVGGISDDSFAPLLTVDAAPPPFAAGAPSAVATPPPLSLLDVRCGSAITRPAAGALVEVVRRFAATLTCVALDGLVWPSDAALVAAVETILR
jgi:hypothetical protein